MSALTDDVKGLFNFKYKKRDDTLTDQYTRLFMPKVMIIASFLTGMSWYSDDISCLVPGLSGGAIGGFSGKACWINGFYIYEELRNEIGCYGYYGMPTNSIHNGTLSDTRCGTCSAIEGNEDCVPMKKKFYIQYQWYPFFLAVCAFLFYAPYFLFHIANDDLKDLKGEIKKFDPDIELIIKTYFNPLDATVQRRQKRNIILNIVMKVGYMIANVVVFCLCDSTLNGDFVRFGTNWIRWAGEPDSNNYVDQRSFVEAGDMLLPTFGFCDVLEEGLDVKHTVLNEHKFVCEISQHVLYQYVLMMLWFLMVIGILVSVYGVLNLLITYAVWEVSFGASKSPKQKMVFKNISIRQGEYLMFIRKKNELYYGKVLENLYQRFMPDPKKISSAPAFEEDTL